MEKYYIRQVNPEYQESFLWDCDYYLDNLVIYGNKNLKRLTTTLFDNVLNVLRSGELTEFLENPKEMKRFYKNVTELIMDYLPPENGRKYSTMDIHYLKENVINCSDLYYYECTNSNKYGHKMVYEQDFLCNVLSIVTGKPWAWQEINDYYDWNYIFYCTDDFNDDDIRYIDSMYFNSGTEWIVHDCETEPECAEDIDGFSCYCVSDTTNEIRKELAKYLETSPENLVLYEFNGYTRTEKYKIV